MISPHHGIIYHMQEETMNGQLYFLTEVIIEAKILLLIDKIDVFLSAR